MKIFVAPKAAPRTILLKFQDHSERRLFIRCFTYERDTEY